jgi:isopentenyl-diphosphate delta-isomerase
MTQTQKRKLDHINVCLEKKVESGRTGFGDINLADMELLHKALPEADFSKIDISCEFLGKKLGAPLMIAAMTGGTPEAMKINQNLAKAAQSFGIAMGIGSQRAAIEDAKLGKTYQLRDVAPDIFIAGNLGIVQFVKGYGLKEAKEAVEMIDADALCLHMNALQEVVQPEGDMNWKGCLDKFSEISKGLRKPVIAKETGAGISREVAKQLEEAGVSAIDIGGLGGTSWSLVEKYRNKNDSDKEIAKNFGDWGIPTAISLIETRESVKIPIIATGGIRNGIEIAKAISMGADMIGIALPLLKPATKSEEDVEKKIYQLIKELKISMFLVGARNLEDLRKKPLVITGKTKDWLEARGIDVKKFADRK